MAFLGQKKSPFIYGEPGELSLTVWCNRWSGNWGQKCLNKKVVCGLAEDEHLAPPISFQKPGVIGNVKILRIKHIGKFFPLAAYGLILLFWIVQVIRIIN